MSFFGYLTDEQRAAHERLLVSLPSVVHKVPSDEPEDWLERDRDLSPEERTRVEQERRAA